MQPAGRALGAAICVLLGMQRQTIRRDQRHGLHDQGAILPRRTLRIHRVRNVLNPPPEGPLMVGVRFAGPLLLLLASLLTKVQSKFEALLSPRI